MVLDQQLYESQENRKENASVLFILRVGTINLCALGYNIHFMSYFRSQ